MSALHFAIVCAAALAAACAGSSSDPGSEAPLRREETAVAQIRVGDELVGTLGESLVLELHAPTPAEQEAGASILEVLASAEPGVVATYTEALRLEVRAPASK